MHRSTRRISSVMVAAVATVLIAATGAQAAPAQSATANVTSSLFHMSFTATRPAGAPSTAATGIFDAQVSFGPLSLMKLHGPVTCLDVRGNSMGLFYPITAATPALFGQIGFGVFIYMTVDGAGHPDRVAFLPVPFSHVSSCVPLPTLLPATGSATLTS